jgi:SnoaL-like domain
VRDAQQVHVLQRTYGYLVDKNLWTQIADLFTDDGTLEIGGRGVFVGKARVLQYLKLLGVPSAASCMTTRKWNR